MKRAVNWFMRQPSERKLVGLLIAMLLALMGTWLAYDRLAYQIESQRYEQCRLLHDDTTCLHLTETP